MKLKLSILIILTVRILVAADENDSKVTIGSTVLHGINLVNASGGYANGTIVTHYNELDGTRELFAGENILACQFASDFWGVLQQSVPDTQIGKYIQNDIDVEQPDYLSILPYLRECIAECDTVWIELTWSTNYDNKGDQAINSVRKCTYEVLGNLQDVPITLAEGMLRKEGNRVFFDWTSHGMTYTTLDSALNKINALNDAGETAKWNALFSATHPLNKRIYFKNRVSRNSETPDLCVVLVDSLRPDHLGCYGCERDTSPTMNVFNEGAARFDQTVSSGSRLRPSFLSMMMPVPADVHHWARCGRPDSTNVLTFADSLPNAPDSTQSDSAR